MTCGHDKQLETAIETARLVKDKLLIRKEIRYL